MNIALVIPSPPAYSETFFRSKIEGLEQNGHEVILVTAKSKIAFDLCAHKTHPKVYANNFLQVMAMLWVGIGLLPYYKQVKTYYQLEKQEKTSWKRILEKIYMNATLLKLDVDWLHFGFATMALERELVAKAIGAKMAVSFRGYDINVFPLKKPNSYDKLWNHVDKVHSISQYLIDKAYTMGLSRSVSLQIISPAVNSKLMQATSAKTSANKLQLLTIARLHYIKGIDLLLETAKILKDAKIEFEWQVIGDGGTADEERYYYHRYELGLDNEVQFLGKLSHQETLEKLKKAGFYVQPSLNEGFCNAILEAQAMGKLSIAFDVGGIPENIQDAYTGFLVKKLDAVALAAKIQEVLLLNSELKEKISRQAQKRVKNSFSLHQQKEAFNRFYTEVIS